MEQRKKWKNKKSMLTTLIYVSPFLVLYLIFFLYPLAKGLMMSFTDWNGLNPAFKFIGLANYKDVINDKDFLHSIYVTFILTIVSMVVLNSLGIILAVLIEKSNRFGKALRVFYFIPFILCTAIIGLVWKMFYTQIIPSVANAVPFLKFLDIDYLGSDRYALMSVIIMNCWYAIGYFTILYISGLQSIDKAYYEAAEIDGATFWQQLRSVTLPLLMPVTTVCIFTGLSTTLKAFDVVYVLTGGGPGKTTELMSINIYNEAFGGSLFYGYAMSKAVVMAIIIMIISFVQLKFFKSREVEV